jgi:hypothetical protein
LNYLQNKQITTNVNFGLHGWCNWDGTIQTKHSYNIGPYPTVEEVYNEWVQIAKTFPYLNLRCQLINTDIVYAHDDPHQQVAKPVVEFIIKDGEVTLVEAKEYIHKIVFPPIDNNSLYDRGCTVELFAKIISKLQ